MKIGLNQPNGFNTHFGKDPYKYLDNNTESKSNQHLIFQTLNIRNNNSILTSIMVVQLLPLPVKTSLLSVVIPDSPKATVLLPEMKLNSFK